LVSKVLPPERRRNSSAAVAVFGFLKFAQGTLVSTYSRSSLSWTIWPDS